MTTVTITVLPSSEHPDYLTVQDAMSQIADAFALLKGEAGEEFDWRLVSATTNSPLTAVGEFASKAPVPAALFAAAQLSVEESYQTISDVLAGEEPAADADSPILRRMLARNLNGIGLTKIEFDDRSPLSITPEAASTGLSVFKPQGLPASPRRVRGTLEGELIDAGTYRGHPALKLRERSRGRILWCRVAENQEAQFAAATSLDDIWKNARVRLRGWIEYSKSGKISRMNAEDIKHVKMREVALGEIFDKDFTGGLNSIQYIDNLRDGELA